VARRASGYCADRGSRAGGRTYGPGVAAFTAIAFDLALGAIELAGVGVGASQARAKIACRAVRESEGIEPQEDLALALYLTGAFRLSHGAGHITAARDHDAAVDENRERSLQIDAVSLR